MIFSVTAATDENSHHVWRLVEDVLVTFTSDGIIDGTTWSQFVEILEVGEFRVQLSFSAGGSISSTQRKGASDAINKHKHPVIVVTDSRVTRGVVTALTWLGANIKANSWSQLDAVLSSLSVSAASEQTIRTLAQKFFDLRVSKD
jgi:hypothetical protein